MDTADIDPNKYRTFEKRFFAGIIDGFVLLPFGVVDTFVFTDGVPWIMALWIPVTCSVNWIYTVAAHAMYGQTVGKKVMNVIVLDNKTEAPITWTQAILRDSFLIVAGIASTAISLYVVLNEVTEPSPELMAASEALSYSLILWFMIEIVSCLTNQKKRALHDFIAGTVVVRTTSPQAAGVSGRGKSLRRKPVSY